MPPIHIRPASSAVDDGQRLIQNFESQLSWLSAIGSGAQWGSTSRDDEETRDKYRRIVKNSEEGWNDPWSRDWVRAYIAEVEVTRQDLSPHLLDGLSQGPEDLVRLPVAGMILQGRASQYVQKVLPENDDDDPFIYLYYLLSDRATAAHGKGAGAALISHAKSEALSLGVKRICVDCWKGNGSKLVQYVSATCSMYDY